jgi:hypothetical protein
VGGELTPDQVRSWVANRSRWSSRCARPGTAIRRGAGDKRATALGHAPLGGAGGTLATIGTARGRCFVTHVNNTNPILDPASDAAAVLARHNVEVAADGLLLEL